MSTLDLRIPDHPSFIDNLILQRTSPFSELGGRDSLDRWFKTGEKAQLSRFLLDNKLLDRYLDLTIKEISADVDQFVELTAGMPKSRLVSIGPGNGLFEVLLHRKTGYDSILLIDIEDTADQALHQHGFATSGSGYASLQGTKSFLSDNGIDASFISTCNPHRQALPDFQFDGLFSMISMGFHYPCDDYADFIIKNATSGGWVILDKREQVPLSRWEKVKSLVTPTKIEDNGFEQLLTKFKTKKSIPSQKSSRLLLQAQG